MNKESFPDKLKNSVVNPCINNQGDSESMENVRPINILSSISKEYESIVNTELTDFLLNNKILKSQQHGFTKNKSLETALSDFISEIVSSLDKKQSTIGLFIDFTKAFDCVNHVILLIKLERYGISGICLKWFESYLTNRRQKVQVNESKSDLANIDIGVPQGSIPGPTLFILFINDLARYLEKFNSLQVSYADDTNFVIIDSTIENAESKIKNIYEELCHWVDKNQLLINKDKTCCILFKLNKGCIPNRTILLGNEVTQYTTSSKFLGIIIDS